MSSLTVDDCAWTGRPHVSKGRPAGGRLPALGVRHRTLEISERNLPMWDDLVRYALAEDALLADLVTEAVAAYEPFAEWRREHRPAPVSAAEQRRLRRLRLERLTEQLIEGIEEVCPSP